MREPFSALILRLPHHVGQPMLARAPIARLRFVSLLILFYSHAGAAAADDEDDPELESEDELPDEPWRDVRASFFGQQFLQ